ncbi:hypothetical protein SAMN05443144_106194 [Fodinibius roseus]|uniref:Uncharacterized protein n=1 Tax=Fodinibius roseus TaxID=1194090 RepID=A0A1M5A0U4_9BACT|nr:type VI secretion system baseplate subunit TssF [Fodinibius roseus]SHF23885.1 hypothetical protein SAMN05443144_106194 [Fodinibius roseus]
MSENRDSIKSRMLRTAAKMWDYPGVENEAAFDPIVALLMNACAAELAKINREKKLSQSRLTEELARLLIPTAATRAAPAHGIASALPLDGYGYVDQKEQFRCGGPQSGAGRALYFSPTGRFPLVDAGVKCQASGNRICELIDHKYKSVLGYAAGDAFLPPAALYVGLDVSDTIESVEELTFCFSLLNTGQKDFFFNHLSSSRWFLNGRELEKSRGYPPAAGKEDGLKELLTSRYRTSARTCREINTFYERRFVTVRNIERLASARGNLPATIQDIFDTDTLGKVDDHLIWIRVEFPKVVSPKLLDDVFCFANCFPVLNRRDHDLMYRLRENLNIIPLKSNDFFFDIRKIVDSENESYHVRDLDDAQANEENSVLLRSRGVGRFGAFEAKEELQYLLETLKDETASYAAVGTEALEKIVSEINVLMGDLEDKVAGMTVDKTTSYLVMRNLKERDSLFVEFSSTAGSRANDIAAGTRLEVIGRSNIRPGSTLLVTPTVGGRDRLSDREKLISFKRTLLAGNRLVTAEDIKAFCREQLGRRVKEIEITKGVANGMGEKEGLMRTIDIVLTSDERVRTSAREWDFLLEDLLAKIRARVAHSFPYRLVVDENDNRKSVGLDGNAGRATK